MRQFIETNGIIFSLSSRASINIENVHEKSEVLAISVRLFASNKLTVCMINDNNSQEHEIFSVIKKRKKKKRFYIRKCCIK